MNMKSSLNKNFSTSKDKEDEIDINFTKFNNFGLAQSLPLDHHFFCLNNFVKLIIGGFPNQKYFLGVGDSTR